jgi:4-amino-4-deoxy-L-arabinose transferase-like glycosyltransferase
VIVLTTEAVAMTLTRVMIDAATALFPFLALFAIALWDRGECREPRLLALAGLLGGLGLSTKYTTFWLWAIMLAAVAVLALQRRRGVKAAIGAAALAGGVSLAVLLPWLVKTWAWSGNPVFPFFFDLLGGRPWDAWAQQRFAAYNAGMGGPLSWHGIWRTPLEMFLVQGSMENLTLGPVFLFALPFVLAARARPRAFALAGAVTLAYLPYWFLSARIVRYLVLVVPCAALLIAHARAALPPGGCARRALGALLIAGMLHNLGSFALDELTAFEPVAVALGAETREAFLARKLPSYDTLRFASRTLPRDAKVFFIGETRGYHLDRDYIANSAHDPSLLAGLVRRTRDAGGVARELRSLGVTHLLYHPGEAVRLELEYRTFNWQPGETRIVEELLTRHARELHRANGVALLELR